MTTGTDTSFGTRIEGYRTGAVLGEGAEGVVLEGVQELTGRPVAIKLLAPDRIADAEAAAGIEREAAILRRLSHPGIVSMVDHGRTGSGEPFLVFEFVRGRTLAAVIDSGEPVPPARALGWMIQAAEALAAAWKVKVIHRDLKPANMMIDERGNLRLMDFGMAGLGCPAGEGSGAAARRPRGTPKYISPEAAMGASPDLRGDIYSLGATFYHLIVGQPPFQAARSGELLDMHIRATLPSPASIAPELPGDICDILEHMLRKEPAERYQTWEDLLDDLKEALLALCVATGSAGPIPPSAPLHQLSGPHHPSGNHGSFASDLPSAAVPLPSNPFRHDEFRDLAEPPPRRRVFTAFRLLMFSIPALAVLGAVLFMPPAGGEGDARGEPNWLARRMAGIFHFDPPEERDPEREWLELRGENVDRLERAMSALIWYAVDHPGETISLDALVAAGDLSEDMLIDVWGNPFVFHRGAMTLRSAGQDGIEHTFDDFVMDRDLRMGHDPDADPRRIKPVGEPAGSPEAEGDSPSDQGASSSTIVLYE